MVKMVRLVRCQHTFVHTVRQIQICRIQRKATQTWKEHLDRNLSLELNHSVFRDVRWHGDLPHTFKHILIQHKSDPPWCELGDDLWSSDLKSKESV